MLELMSVAQSVDFKRIGRGGSSQSEGWRKGVTYNALLHEGKPRINGDI